MKQQFSNISRQDGKTVIMLYGEVGEGCTVDSHRIVSELFAQDREGAPVEVHINSYGGDVFSGMAIYNALRQSRSDITLYIDGVAASIAAIIALCGKPLYMSPYARLMLHNVSGGTCGNAAKMRQTAEQMDALQKDLADMIARRMGMDAGEVSAAYFDGTDHWITAQEALRMKLADGIYDMDEVDNPPRTPEGIYNYFNNRFENKPQNNVDMALIDDIKQIPSFENKADNASVVAHIRELTSKAVKADALAKTVESYKNQIETLHMQQDDALVGDAVKAGKITAEQADTFKGLLKSDRENTVKLLDSMKGRTAPRAAQYIDTGQTGAPLFHNKTWDEIDRENRLATLKEQDFALFKDLYRQKFGVDYIE